MTIPLASQQPESQPNHRMLAPVPENRHLSSGSRISLPDEAKQYITNMTDSPSVSPGPETSSPKSRLGTSLLPQSGTDSQESEFLDMDEESDEESDIEDAGDVTAGANNPSKLLLLCLHQASFLFVHDSNN